MPPIGIGIGIGRMPPAAAPAPPAISAGVATPAIAALPNRVGIDPCHVGGTDTAPTMRALPRLADIAPPSPPAPNGFIAGRAP